MGPRLCVHTSLCLETESPSQLHAAHVGEQERRALLASRDQSSSLAASLLKLVGGLLQGASKHQINFLSIATVVWYKWLQTPW